MCARPPRALTALSATPLCAGCLLYTQPINSPPTVNISGPGEVYRGGATAFSAVSRDPDNDPLVLEWSHEPQRCPLPVDARRRPASDYTGATYRVTPEPGVMTFCVWVRATDPHGASAIDALEVSVRDHAPVAKIDVLQPSPSGPYPLYSDFRLSAAASTDADADALSFAWRLVSVPHGLDPVPPLADCTQGAGASSPMEVVCFTALAPGPFTVELVANDGVLASKPVERALDVDPDQPPCIDVTTPDYRASPVASNPDESARFEVSRVGDDGDPLPPGPYGGARFKWWIRREAGPPDQNTWREVPGYDLPSLTIAAGTFEPGETAKLRVEALDRRSDDPDRSLSFCALDDRDVCWLGDDPSCPQWITWTVYNR